MASRDRPRSERKKRNDTELQEKRNEKREQRREAKKALNQRTSIRGPRCAAT